MNPDPIGSAPIRMTSANCARTGSERVLKRKRYEHAINLRYKENLTALSEYNRKEAPEIGIENKIRHV
jgi:hypothetical protein